MIDKVYIIFEQDYDQNEVSGVYLSEENAKAEANRLNNARVGRTVYYAVEEHRVIPFQYIN